MPGLREIMLSVAVALASGAGAHGGILIFVDDDAPPGGDGTTWESAYRHLQDALSAAESAQTVEIWVAGGEYRPDRTAASPGGNGDRDARFTVPPGTNVRGGFFGLGARDGRDPNERDLVGHETVLSGDLAGDDGPGFANTSENAIRVVDVQPGAPSGVLDGCTVTARNGAAAGEMTPPPPGGPAGPTPVAYVDCTFALNQGQHGGAILVTSDTAMTGCRFIGNTAENGAAFAVDGGGDASGAITAQVTNCLFLDNTSTGPIVEVASGSLSVASSTFVNNHSDEPGGSMVRGVSGATVVVAGSIFWENAGTPVGADAGSVFSITHSHVGQAGRGNLADDPMFAAPGAGDFRLRAGSTAIDSGDNTAVAGGIETDLAGEPRFVDDPETPDGGVPDGVNPIVDRGAYEFQGDHAGCAADTNGDGVVDVADLIAVILAWGSADPEADVTGDGVVGVPDLAAVLAAWGRCGFRG